MMRLILNGKRSIEDYRVKSEEGSITITMNYSPLTPEQVEAIRVRREQHDLAREARGLSPEVYCDITLNLS
jgi:hypothetical protein